MRLLVERLLLLLLMVTFVIVFMFRYRKAYFSAFCNFFDFKGKCSRKDFWQFMVTHYLLIAWGETLIWAFHDHSHMDEISEFCLVIVVIYYLITLIPVIAIEIRRYHDVGKKWYWIFIPIANIVLLFMPSILSNTTSQNNWIKTSETTQTIQLCIKCGEHIGKNANFCATCGTQVNARQKKICPNCHVEYENEMFFCKMCGAKLDE